MTQGAPIDRKELKDKITSFMETGRIMPIKAVSDCMAVIDQYVAQEVRKGQVSILKEVLVYRPYKVGGDYQIIMYKNEVRDFVDSFDIQGFINDLEPGVAPLDKGKKEI